MDILSGTYSVRGLEQMAGLFQVLWGKADGTYSKAETLNGSDGKPLYHKEPDKSKITNSICTRPYSVDWDRDGDLDLVVGNFRGTFHLYTGNGKGSFDPEPTFIKVGDSSDDLKVNGYHSDPMVIDFDGDGDLDIVSGSTNGDVQWSENKSPDSTKHDLAAFQTLVENPFAREFQQMRGRQGKDFAPVEIKDLKGPAQSTRVWVTDYNEDGKLDILVGDKVDLLQPGTGLNLDQTRKQLKVWEGKRSATYEKLRKTDRSSKAYQAASREYSKVYMERKSIVAEERTGLVWLYLQK